MSSAYRIRRVRSARSGSDNLGQPVVEAGDGFH